jgi:hypothetical protein
LKAPVVGECGGITANIENSFRDENSSKEMNSCAKVIGAETGRLGATTTAGSDALATQQFDWAVLRDSDACEQQLCAPMCVRCMQVPNGASNAPINTMATAARWKTPLNMVSAYHENRVLL